METEENVEGIPSLQDMDYLLKRSFTKGKHAIIINQEDKTIFCCTECPLKYEDKESMELHMCMHNKEYRFLCTVCGVGLKRREHLERHQMEHQEYRPHVCPDCGKGFKRKEHMRIHQNIHANLRSHICQICNRSFHRKDHMRKHMQVHNRLFNDSAQQDYDQGLVVKTEPQDDEMGDYPDIMEPDCELKMQEPMEATVDPERPFACSICSKTFKRKDHLKLHSYIHQRKDYVCSECGKAYHKSEQLLVHMGQHVQSNSLLESDTPTDGTWKDCSKLSESSLLIPIVPAVPKPPEHRPHECPVCHKRFKRRQHLKVHSQTHKNITSNCVWCSICYEGFPSNELFDGHSCIPAKTDNSENVDRTQHAQDSHDSLATHDDHATDEAGDTQNKFLANFMLKEHNQADEAKVVLTPSVPVSGSNDTERSLPVPVRVFVCKICGKQFRRKDHYKIHLNIHTGIKSFFCPYCQKGFYRRDHMQKHKLVHERARPRPAPPALAPPAPAPPRLSAAARPPPALYPLAAVRKQVEDVTKKLANLPEITIHAPSSSKLRLPLQMKIPYQIVSTPDITALSSGQPT